MQNNIFFDKKKFPKEFLDILCYIEPYLYSSMFKNTNAIFFTTFIRKHQPRKFVTEWASEIYISYGLGRLPQK